MTLYETIGLNNFIILQDYSNTSFDFIPCFDLYSLVRNPISYQYQYNVEFKGFMEKEDLLETIRASAFVVAPSLWHDNSPMAVYEAMACGKAVIASKLGGLVDQVNHKENGELVTPGDATELAEVVKSLFEDKRLLKSYGIAGRKRMESEFHPQIHLDRLEAILEGASD